MNSIRQTKEFTDWLNSLRDRIGKGAIVERLRRAELGNFGDHKTVGGSIFELIIHTGPGYRVYMVRSGNTAYTVLVGGDKSTQNRDLDTARKLAKDIANAP